MDATSRNDLREMNELNFARFDAKLEQRVAEIHARIDKVAAELNAKIDTVAAGLREYVERRIGEQSRWLVAGWVTLMAAVIGLWFRG